MANWFPTPTFYFRSSGALRISLSFIKSVLTLGYGKAPVRARILNKDYLHYYTTRDSILIIKTKTHADIP